MFINMNYSHENRMHNIAMRGRERGESRGEVRCCFPSLATLGKDMGMVVFQI